MKYSTLTSKASDLKPEVRPSLTFARRNTGECMWFDRFGVLCRFSEAEKNYEQRFVSLTLDDLCANDWYIIKAVTA